MSVSPEGRSSKLQYDGGMIHFQTVAKTAFDTAAVADLGGFVAPCDLTLKEVRYRVLTQNTADSTVDLGINGDDDAGIAAYVIGAAAAGEYKMSLSDSTVLDTTVNAGDYVFWTLNADADAAGNIAICAVWVPTIVEA